MCWCNPGWGGPECSWRLCPDGCSGRGWCRDGECHCPLGYGGPGCGLLLGNVSASPVDCATGKPEPEPEPQRQPYSPDPDPDPKPNPNSNPNLALIQAACAAALTGAPRRASTQEPPPGARATPNPTLTLTVTLTVTLTPTLSLSLSLTRRACYLRCSRRCALHCNPTAESVESPPAAGEPGELAQAEVEAEAVYERPSYSSRVDAARGALATHALQPLAASGPLW